MTRPEFETILADPQFPEGAAWQRRRFDAGQVVVQAGDIGRSLFIVESGALRVTAQVVLGGDKRVRPGICDLGPGDFFGELSLFEAQPRSATVVATTACELVEIDADRLSALFERHPETGYRMMKVFYTTMIARLRTANERFEYLFAWGLRSYGMDQHL